MTDPSAVPAPAVNSVPASTVGAVLPPEPVSGEAVAGRLVAEARAQIEAGRLRKKPLVWLELNGCSGNIISLLDGTYPNFEYLVTSLVDLVFDNSLMAAEGEQAIERLLSALDGEYILAVEGAVALREGGRYNVIGRWRGQPLTGLAAAKMLGVKASQVIAVGACAVDGGPSAARPNLAQCVGLSEVLERPMIKLPGCPCHPDWVLGTLAHLLLYGEPELDAAGRPLLFYGSLIHDRCPRRSFFDRGIFARTLAEDTCLFKLGCRGPVTPVDCPTRRWNGYINWPIGASTCIGCAQFGFPDAMAPFVSYDVTREAP